MALLHTLTENLAATSRPAEQGRQSRGAGRSLVVGAGSSPRSTTRARLEAGRGDRAAAPARGRHG